MNKGTVKCVEAQKNKHISHLNGVSALFVQ